jgi:hypothetical protein
VDAINNQAELELVPRREAIEMRMVEKVKQTGRLFNTPPKRVLKHAQSRRCARFESR